jgi:uncharacterized coiled-coil protein SlyX/rRNA processing protein Gar1
MRPFEHRAIVVAAAILMVSARAVHALAQCPPGTVQVGTQNEETADAIIVHPVCQPLSTPAPAPANPSDSRLASQICASRNLIKRDQDAIKALNFGVTAKDFEEIAKLTQERKDELQEEAVDAMLGAVLDETSERAIMATTSVNPFNAQKYIGQLKRIGVQSGPLNDAIRNMAHVKDKHELAEAFNTFTGAAKSVYEGYEVKDKGTAKALAATSIGMVGALRNQPELGAIAAETNLLIALAYSGQLESQIEQLNSMTNEKLQTLDRLTKRLKNHVDRLHALKDTWSDQFPGSSLPCPN